MNNSVNLPKPFFVSIIPHFPGEEEYLAQLIAERFKKTGITDYAMSFPLHPQGDDIYDKVKIQKETFRKLKALLAGEKEIRLGILFQTTLGHGGYWNLAPQCGIEADKILKADGSETHRCCPLDQRFLDYIYNCIATLCEERPAFTLGDDDMRMFDGTCYCDRHVKMVSEMLGREYTRQELADAIANAAPHDPVAIAFEKAQINAMEKLSQTMRKAIDSIDPSISCGCCIVSTRYDYAEMETRVLAGGTEPFLRISNAYYLEGAPKEEVWRNASTGFQVVNARKWGFKLLDESDTCPHNRYSKSARTMHQHITSGLLMGLDGGKLWLDQGAYPLREVSRPYEKILSENQYFYRQVLHIRKNWTPAGGVIHVPALDREPYPVKGQHFFNGGDWNSCCFGKMGFPVRYEDTAFKGGISLLSGGQSDYYTDEEIREMLSGAALIDGAAAVKLTARGFGAMMGAEALETAPRGSVEVQKSTGIRMGFLAAKNTPVLKALPGSEVLSEVFFSQYKGGASEFTMPGSTFFTNAAGGKVIVTAMNIKEWHYMHVLNPGRKEVYTEFLRRLGGVPCYLLEQQDARINCGFMPDGALVCAVFNYSADPLKIRLAVEKAPRQVERLSSCGMWEPIASYADGNVVETACQQETGTVGIYRLS